MGNFKYKKPFKVASGVIYDADGREIRLWGVNYYAPHNHNYVNLKEMGIDHCRAVDRDLKDLLALGVEIVRLHLFDREISDMDGNLVDNDHMRVLDYLVASLEKNGVYMMLTSIAWWNSVENQVIAEQNYAYWDMSKNPAYGFSNFFPKHTMMWSERAIECQKRYISQLLEHVNRFTGKRFCDHECIAVFEAINEPEYPFPHVLERIMANRDKLALNPTSREEVKLIDKYEGFLSETGLEDNTDTRNRFTASIVDKYVSQVMKLADGYFGDRVLKTHIHYGYDNKYLLDMLSNAPIDCVSVSGYSPGSFDTDHRDWRNHYADAMTVFGRYSPLKETGKGLVGYEWNAHSTLLSYPLAAYAFAMASSGVQIAAYFTYTPVDVAPYNPGWIIHFLNRFHTPGRAAAFRLAGELFRNLPAGVELPEGTDGWHAPGFLSEAKRDLSVYENGPVFLHSGKCEDYRCGTVPEYISGSGSSPFVRYDGNGIYELAHTGEDTLRLTVLPNQFFVSDPYRGKAFRGMANRYVNTNRESVVSRLYERGSEMRIVYPGFEKYEVYSADGERAEAPEGVFRADTGTYIVRAVK